VTRRKPLLMEPADTRCFTLDVPAIVSLNAVQESATVMERDAIRAIIAMIQLCRYAKDDIEVRTHATQADPLYGVVYRYSRQYWSKSENRMLAGYWLDAMVGDTAIRLTRDLSPLKERYEQVEGATDGT